MKQESCHIEDPQTTETTLPGDVKAGVKPLRYARTPYTFKAAIE